MVLAYFDDGADGKVEPLLRVVPVGQQHVRTPDRITVDGQAAAEPSVDRPWESTCGDVTPRRAIDRFPAVCPADDVADVVAVDEQLVGLLHRAPVGP